MMRTKLAVPALLSLLALTIGCKQELPRVTAVTNAPTGVHQPGRFVWHDLMTHDVEATKAFYGGLFGWEFESAEDSDGTYTTIRHDGKPIGGIIYLGKVQDEVNSQWLSYVSVRNVDTALQTVEKGGGRVYRKPLDLPDRGRLSVIMDNREAFVGLLHATGGDPLLDAPVYDEWLWHELWTDDIESSMSFYVDVGGYERGKIKIGDYDYGVLEQKGKLRGGVVPIGMKGVTPNWLPYVAVEDPAGAVEKARSLGGRLIVKSEGSNRAAILMDPSGAAFGLHIWPLPDNIQRGSSE
jgi:predicted enzyme related to lactoylglutathione lyase